MKILYVQTNGIGNTILSTPSMKAIRTIFPKATYELLIDPLGRQVVNNWGIFDRIYSMEPYVAIAEDYDIIVIAQPSDDKRIGWVLNKAKKIVGARPIFLTGSYNIRHEVEVNMHFAVELGYNGPTPALYVDTVPENPSLDNYKDKIAFHMGISESPLKQRKSWPLEYWRRLIDKTKSISDIMVIGGTNERESVQKICKERGIINTCGDFTIGELARVLKSCRLLVSIDSGPMHIAAAAGTPIVALFGPTRVSKNRPWINNDGKAIVITSNSFCAPCQFTYSFKSCKKDTCMRSISVEKVFDAISLIDKIPQGSSFRYGGLGLKDLGEPSKRALTILKDFWNNVRGKISIYLER